MIPKKVKIVSTLGPASDHPQTILELAREGVNVFRINLSHATEEEIINRINWVRAAEKELGIPLAVLGDLAGPKIRLGEMQENVIIEKDDEMDIVFEQVVGDKGRFSLNHPSIVPQLKVGAEIFIDDGKLKLEVVKEGKEKARAKVIVGGLLKPRKGFNAQGISLAAQGLSEKDKKDFAFVVKLGADAVAISFVQTAKDVQVVRDLLPKNSSVMLIPKIETMKGTEEIEKIIDVSDGIMVARGDLGLAVPMEEIPHLQKRIITLCRERAKPVITATQMLESMTTNPIPTRAEVTDVSNAIMDGTDCVMLSGETAAGNFPVETVKMMSRIIRRTSPLVEPQKFEKVETVSHAVSSEVGDIADRIRTPLIVVFTQSGSAARKVSRHRPHQIIIALSPNITTVRQLNFSSSVYSMHIEKTKDFEHMVDQARKVAVKNTIAPIQKGDDFVISAGVPFGQSGTTNLLYVAKA